MKLRLATAKMWSIETKSLAFSEMFSHGLAEWMIIKSLGLLPKLKYVCYEDRDCLRYLFDDLTQDELIRGAKTFFELRGGTHKSGVVSVPIDSAIEIFKKSKNRKALVGFCQTDVFFLKTGDDDHLIFSTKDLFEDLEPDLFDGKDSH